MHMLLTIVNHNVLFVAPSKMLQQSADDRFSSFKTKKIHKNIFFTPNIAIAKLQPLN